MMLLKDLCHRPSARGAAGLRGDYLGAAVARQRMSRLEAKRQPVTPEKLDEIAGNANTKSADVPAKFGYGRSAFFKLISSNLELWRVYERARTRAGFEVRGLGLTEKKRMTFSPDEQIIVNGIRGGHRRPGELRSFAIAAGVDARRYDNVLYILENEKHEIESCAEGRPPVTRFFTRDEREEKEEAA